MKIKIIVPLLALIAAGSCEAQKNTKSQEEKSVKSHKKPLLEPTKKRVVHDHEASETVHLKQGQNIFLNEQQMNLTFTRVLADSRCPAGTNCVWAGNATVEIEVMATTSRPMRLQLSIGDLRNKLNNSVDFNGYKITLEKLLPESSSNQNAKNLDGRYRVDLRIDKITTQ